MNTVELKGKRGNQVLELLCKHGPLSIRTLEEVIRPKMHRKRVMEVAARLSEKGLIFPVDASDSLRGSTVFEVSRSLERRATVASMLGRGSVESLVAYVRGREIKHGEQCARWFEFLKRECPDAEVVRDWEIGSDSYLRERILATEENGGLFPDFVLKFKRQKNLEPVLVGVEVERSLKKFGRLLHKMRTLVMQTQLDGVVYLCDHSGIGEAVRRAIRESGMSKSRRIGRYFNNYLVFASMSQPLLSQDVGIANLALDKSTLKNWLNTLRAIPAHEREDYCFREPGFRPGKDG